MHYNKSWTLKAFTTFNSNNNSTISSTPSTRVDIVYCNYSLRISTKEINKLIYLKPEMYILNSTNHLGILSFDSCFYGYWVLSFYDKPSTMNCIDTLRSNGMIVTDIQKLLSKMVYLENSIINTIKNAEFPIYVAQVENAMKNKNI